MPVSYTIHTEHRIITYQVLGQNNLETLLALFTEITQDPDYDTSFDGVADWRKATTSLNREEVRILANYVVENRLSSGIWVALAEEPMVTAYAQLYSSTVKNQHPMEVCCTIEYASELVNLDLSLLLQQ